MYHVHIESNVYLLRIGTCTVMYVHDKLQSRISLPGATRRVAELRRSAHAQWSPSSSRVGTARQHVHRGVFCLQVSVSIKFKHFFSNSSVQSVVLSPNTYDYLTSQNALRCDVTKRGAPVHSVAMVCATPSSTSGRKGLTTRHTTGVKLRRPQTRQT